MSAAPELHVGEEPEEKLTVRMTYGLRKGRPDDPDPSKSDPLPASFPRHILSAHQFAKGHAEKLSKERGKPIVPQLSVAAQDLNRLVMSRPFIKRGALDVKYLEDVLAGRKADAFADELIELSADRKAMVRATVDMLCLDTVFEVTSVIEMVINDERMRRFYLSYLAAVAPHLAERSNTLVFRGQPQERPLRTVALNVLPKALRTAEDKRTEDRIYPNGQGAYGAWTVLNRGIYIAPPGYEKIPEFGDKPTIEVLRMLTAEIVRTILPTSPKFTERFGEEVDFSALATKIENGGWLLVDELMGKACKTGRPVDPYYYYPTDPNNGGPKEGESETAQFLIRPTPNPVELHNFLLEGSTTGGIESKSKLVALRTDVIPLIKETFAQLLQTPAGNAALRAIAGVHIGYDALKEWIQNPRDTLPRGDVKMLSRLLAAFADQLNYQTEFFKTILPVHTVKELRKSLGLPEVETSAMESGDIPREGSSPDSALSPTAFDANEGSEPGTPKSDPPPAPTVTTIPAPRGGNGGK